MKKRVVITGLGVVAQMVLACQLSRKQLRQENQVFNILKP